MKLGVGLAAQEAWPGKRVKAIPDLWNSSGQYCRNISWLAGTERSFEQCLCWNLRELPGAFSLPNISSSFSFSHCLIVSFSFFSVLSISLCPSPSLLPLSIGWVGWCCESAVANQVLQVLSMSHIRHSYVRVMSSLRQLSWTLFSDFLFLPSSLPILFALSILSLCVLSIVSLFQNCASLLSSHLPVPLQLLKTLSQWNWPNIFDNTQNITVPRDTWITTVLRKKCCSVFYETHLSVPFTLMVIHWHLHHAVSEVSYSDLTAREPG